MRYTPGAGRQRIGTRDFQYDNRQDLNVEESAEERADALRRGHQNVTILFQRSCWLHVCHLDRTRCN